MTVKFPVLPDVCSALQRARKQQQKSMFVRFTHTRSVTFSSMKFVVFLVLFLAVASAGFHKE
jgi:hypothetical protein